MNWKAQNIITKEVGICRTQLYKLEKAKVIEKRNLGKSKFYDFDAIQQLINNNGIPEIKKPSSN